MLGKFKANLKRGSKETNQDIYVVKDLKEPLLGKKAIEQLDLIKRINMVETKETSIESGEDCGSKMKRKYPNLFKGLGKLEKEYKITMKKDAKPFKSSALRRISLPMRKKVKKELDRLLQEDIIRPVTKPTDWCAGLVVVPKQNDAVRLCIYLTKLNEGVQRENYPLPKTEELLGELAGA